MLSRRISSILLLAMPLIVLEGCGSKLNPALKVRPKGTFDFSKMRFTDLETQQEIGLQSYMELNRKDYLLLMFGSVGCSSCNKKSIQLRDNYWGKHELFLEHNLNETRFELLGVNTDSGNAARQFQRIWSDPRLRTGAGYDHIRLADPAGDVLRTFLIPPGKKFGVPFTIMFSRNGIAWLISSEETVSLADIISKVEQTVGHTKARPSAEDATEPSPKPSQVKASPIALALPGRFKDVSLTSCSGEPVSLFDLTRGARELLIQISRDDCSSDACRANRTYFSSDNALKSLSISSERPAACDPELDFVGGAEFLASENGFLSTLNWRPAPVLDPEIGIPAYLPEIEDPMVLKFSLETGRLSGVAAGSANQATMSMGEVSYAMTHRIITPGGQVTPFDDWHQKWRYSILVMMDPSCSGCRKELMHWEAPGNLYDFCEASSGFCSIHMIQSTSEYYTPPAERRQMLEESLREGPLAVTRTRVIVDADFLVTKDPEFGDELYSSKISESYLIPYSQPGGGFNPWIFIVDEEGKIVFQLESTEPHGDDPVFKFIKDQFATFNEEI